MFTSKGMLFSLYLVSIINTECLYRYAKRLAILNRNQKCESLLREINNELASVKH